MTAAPKKYARRYPIAGGSGLEPVAGSPPLIRRFFDALGQSDLSANEICVRAGVNRNTIQHWAGGSCPGIHRFNDVLQVLGLTLAIVPIEGRP